jgi:hypothetical protein
LPLSASVAGTVAQAPSATAGDASLTIDLRATGGVDGTMRVVLQGRTLATGGLALRSGTGVLGPAAKPDLYQGRVVSLIGSRMALVMQDAAGERVDVTLVLVIHRAAGTCTGSLSAVAAPVRAGAGVPGLARPDPHRRLPPLSSRAPCPASSRPILTGT